MKRIFACLLLVPLCLFSAGCETKNAYLTTEFFAMNTFVSLSVDGGDTAFAEDLKADILSIEKTFSATYENSETTTLSDGTYVSDRMQEVLAFSLKTAADTDGTFDPTLGSLIRLWNVNGVDPRVPSDEQVTQALSECGYRKISLSREGVYRCDDPNVKLDFGAIVKGYAGQKQIERLKENGIENAAVNIGGNVSVIGSSEQNRKKGTVGWTVGINNPFDTSTLLGTLTTTDTTVSVSGSYERYFEENGLRYHHIFDSKTGYPARSGLVSVAVVARDGMTADALSTALFVLGVEDGIKLYESEKFEFEALFCTENGEVYATDGMRALFVPDESAENADGGKIVFCFENDEISS